MITYKEYINERELNISKAEDKLSLLMFLVENEDSLNESLETLNEEEMLEGIKDWLGKFGLKVHKGDGVIDYIRQFSSGAGKLIIAAIKGDKKKVQEIANSIEKEKVADFIFKLDMLTMHMLTGPIHFIDALTGWDLVANLKHAAKQVPNMLQDIWSSLTKIKDNVKSIVSSGHEKTILKNISSIEASLPKA